MKKDGPNAGNHNLDIENTFQSDKETPFVDPHVSPCNYASDGEGSSALAVDI